MPLMAKSFRTGPSGQMRTRRPRARSTERWMLISAASPVESMNVTALRLMLTACTPLRSAWRAAEMSWGELTMSISPLEDVPFAVELRRRSPA